jgi:hypothetical protein
MYLFAGGGARRVLLPVIATTAAFLLKPFPVIGLSPRMEVKLFMVKGTSTSRGLVSVKVQVGGMMRMKG